MRKIMLIFILIFLFPNIQNLEYLCLADSTKTYYAKVENTSTYIYSAPVKSDEAKIFEIPASYYVLLTDHANNDFYKAKYSDVEGYVLKNSVTPVTEKPNYPFTTTYFRVFSPTYLYSAPYSDAEHLATLERETDITNYYGQIEGDELLSYSTKQWYYCSYLDKSTNTQKKGYVFAYYCDGFQDIHQNNEPYTEILEELVFFEEDPKIPVNSMTTTAKVMIAVACALPSLIIILLLMKKKSPSNVKQKKVLKKPKRDYFEFNEDDI